MGSGRVDDKSRSYIACTLLSSLVTVPRGYGVRITACPGSWDSCPTVAGPCRCVTLALLLSPVSMQRRHNRLRTDGYSSLALHYGHGKFVSVLRSDARNA